MAKRKELELKVRIDPDSVEDMKERCKSVCTFLRKEDITDYFFEPKDKELLSELRMRKFEDGRTITLKILSLQEKLQVNEEFKFEVKGINAFEEFLKELKFKPCCMIHKHSTFYSYDGIEIEITSVDELGSFIEFKLHGHEDFLEKNKGKIMNLILEFDIDESAIDSRYYSQMMIEKENE